MLSEDALAQLGIKLRASHGAFALLHRQKLPQQKTFSLSGWFRSYTGAGTGFLSEAYCKKRRLYAGNGRDFVSDPEKTPQDFQRLKQDVPLSENQTLESNFELDSQGGSVIAMLILLVFFIIGSGYLLIYNILYISIAKDTRFYGLIKTLGTTQTQIKALVKSQALRFACIGIPVGILAGQQFPLCWLPLC